MNETINHIMSRRSQRVYADKPIIDAEKKLIIESAMRAPTAGNMMLYSIIEVADQSKKDRLVATCDNQPFIAKAPLVLIFLADMQRWYDYYEQCDVRHVCRHNNVKFEQPAEADLMLASCDALIAAQTAVIAAESIGIGSCYIGDIMENIEIHREMFDLPSLVFPVTMLCFGHITASGMQRSLTPRFPQDCVHFTDSYKRLETEEFDAMYAGHISNQGGRYLKNAENFGQHFYLKKTGSDFFQEMRRSVKVALLDWRGGVTEGDAE
jgi:nitroreductase